jgi:uncharacterized membrane protein YfcA
VPWLSTEVLKAIFALFLFATVVYLAFFDDADTREPLRGLAKLAAAAGIGALAQVTGTGGDGQAVSGVVSLTVP